MGPPLIPLIAHAEKESLRRDSCLEYHKKVCDDVEITRYDEFPYSPIGHSAPFPSSGTLNGTSTAYGAEPGVELPHRLARITGLVAEHGEWGKDGVFRDQGSTGLCSADSCVGKASLLALQVYHDLSGRDERRPIKSASAAYRCLPLITTLYSSPSYHAFADLERGQKDQNDRAIRILRTRMQTRGNVTCGVHEGGARSAAEVGSTRSSRSMKIGHPG